jgi:flagellar protein FlbD
MLTRINGQTMAVNSDLIKLVETSHDTVITLLTGEKILVREDTVEVISRIIIFRRAILSTERLAASLPHSHFSSGYLKSERGNNAEDK